jgi:FixJ family two-component response regulator
VSSSKSQDRPAERGKKKDVQKAPLAERKSRGAEIDKMIIGGKSNQEIVDALDGAVSISNVSVRRSRLKKHGALG